MFASQVLLTGFAIFSAGFCVYFAWRAGISAEKASHSEHRLAIMRGQVRGLEVALAALDASHQKLAGRIYAGMRRDREPANAEANELVAGVECEYWAIAQQDGPNSEAAKCGCAWCEAKRAERARRRASMRPAGGKS